MARLDDAAILPLLKTYYPNNNKIQNMAYKRSRTLEMLPKNTNFGGDGVKLPLLYDDLASGSASYTKALNNTDASKQVAFTIDVVTEYSSVPIETLAFLRARNDMTSFMRGKKREIDSAINRCAQRVSGGLFRKSTGSIGTIGSGYASTTVVLGSRADVVNFYKDQKLIFSATDGSARRSATEVTVTAVARETGTLTLSAAPSSVSVAANGEYIYTSGDEQNGGTAVRAYGFSDYLPSTAPTSGDSFAGSVDRSVDPTRLAGVRHDGSAQTIEAGLIDLLAEVQFQGGDPSVIVMNPLQGGQFIKALGSKVFYDQVASDNKEVGAKKLMAYVGSATCEIVFDRWCPATTAFALDPSVWECISIFEVPHIWEYDGIRSLRSEAFDGFKLLVSAYYNLMCFAPGYNGRLTLPSLP